LSVFLLLILSPLSVAEIMIVILVVKGRDD